MNFKSDQHHARDLKTCPGCSEPGDVMGSRNTQRHVMVCPEYQVFREDSDRAAEYGESWEHCSQEISEEKQLCQEIPVEKQYQQEILVLN